MPQMTRLLAVTFVAQLAQAAVLLKVLTTDRDVTGASRAVSPRISWEWATGECPAVVGLIRHDRGISCRLPQDSSKWKFKAN